MELFQVVVRRRSCVATTHIDSTSYPFLVCDFSTESEGHTWSGSCSVRDQSASYSDSFAKLLVQIANLPLELSSSVADETFGTAVATGGYFGGTNITTFYSTHDLYAAFLSASASGDQGIHDSGYFWSVGGTASTMKETADGILWEKSYLHRYSSSLGVTPPADGSSYVKAIGNNCVPTRLELLPLHSLVQLKGIEGLDSSEVKFVVSQLQDAEIRYCYEIGICGSTPTPQPTKAPDLFGGLYWVKDCGGGDTNPYTKNFNCPTGYQPFPVGRTLTPEEKVGANIYLCLRDPTVHENENFGGMFQQDDVNSQDNQINPLTGGLGCPSGYLAIKVARVTTPEPNKYGANIFYCFKEVEPVGTSQMGGFFMQADTGTQGNVINQYTLATSCPYGYTPYRAGRHYGPESKVGMNFYVCLNNV